MYKGIHKSEKKAKWSLTGDNGYNYFEYTLIALQMYVPMVGNSNLIRIAIAIFLVVRQVLDTCIF